MSDPVVAAVERVWASAPKRRTAWEEWLGNPFGKLATSAAYAALAPLRDLHYPEKSGGKVYCHTCVAYCDPVRKALWPTETDRLIYSEDELG